MDKVLNFLNENNDAMTVVGVLLTFLISAISLYYSKRNNRAVHYVNAVTKNRVEWIYKLRNYMSEYITLIAINDYTELIHGDKELAQHFEKVLLVKNNIKLLLNYNGKLDKDIIKYANDLENLSNKFYGTLNLFEALTDEELTDYQKDELVAYNKFVRKYVVDYMECQGIKYDSNTDIYGLLFSLTLLEDIKKLRSRNKISSWDIGLALECTAIIETIKQKIEILTRTIHVYLKFEWNRVKYEAEGKIYYNILQKFDLKELLEISENPNYKNKKIKRFFLSMLLAIWDLKYSILFVLCAIGIIIAGLYYIS